MEDSADSYGVGARSCHDEQEETSSLVILRASYAVFVSVLLHVCMLRVSLSNLSSRPNEHGTLVIFIWSAGSSMILPLRMFLQQAPAAETEPTEWTDEKHSLYLKSMEATFVNQLYKSLDLFGRQSEKNSTSGSKSSKPKQTSIRAPSGQFKVLRDGCWSKIDFKRDEAEVNQEEESGVLLANPWIQHYRRSEKQDNRTYPASCSKAPLATTVNQCSVQNFQLWRQDSVGSNTEVTDQNFNDDDLEEENCTRIHEIKRRKTSTDTVPSNDQAIKQLLSVANMFKMLICIRVNKSIRHWRPDLTGFSLFLLSRLSLSKTSYKPMVLLKIIYILEIRVHYIDLKHCDFVTLYQMLSRRAAGGFRWKNLFSITADVERDYASDPSYNFPNQPSGRNKILITLRNSRFGKENFGRLSCFWGSTCSRQ
ncbi:UNVERIFIED_CONTAM: Cold-regulated protein 27 [Sesamum radiatum]|uniref:Cold-regulated protein 27 n=1 Tax=Sesamum radiatum TaxID=300843 RepID=A0AAW2QEB0_SESRA